MIKGYQIFFIIFMLSLIALSTQGCKRKEPVYRLKTEIGEDTSAHYEKEQGPKKTRLKMSEYRKAKAARERQKEIDKARGIYRKESRWDP